jgi:heparan-alpha-glucosaminide N-acetyltransferase
MSSYDTSSLADVTRYQPPSAPAESGSSRIVSVDIFRGLTLLVMIFVNDLAEVKGLPWWTYHLPGNVNGMTYVDMVFPFFLFIVGISTPLAIRHRVSRGDSAERLWIHVITRSFALIVLGIALANAEKVDAQLTHVNASAWGLLTLVGAILFWAAYPRSERYKALFTGMKLAGLLLIIVMFAIFRRVDQNGHSAWLDFGYWEILGLIGWTYFGVAILYIPTRRWRWAPLLWLVALVALNAASLAKWIGFTNRLPFYYWPWNTGCLCLITMAGIVVSTILLSDAFATTFVRRAALVLGFAAILFAGGWLLTPLGISKIRATPTWGLYSAAAATLCFLLLYWVCDVQKHSRWAQPVRPAGSNTLLTYLLPDLFYFAFGGLAAMNLWRYGWPGVARSLLFTGLMICLAATFTRLRIRMQL